MTALQRLLTEDAVLISDGGGNVAAVLNPIHSAERVARFFADLVTKFGYKPLTAVDVVRINGLPGYVTVENGVLQTTTLEFDGDRISGIFVVRNPDKLTHIHPRQQAE